MDGKVSFATFFMIWAEHRRWVVPDVHWLAVHWLEHRGLLAVLRCFRGFGKSTILAVYNAWRYYQNPEYRILHQSEADGTAYKTSRDTQAVLNAHPLTRELFREGGVEQWWVHGATDARNASMFARGILSNVTSARCDEAQNDDVEVPRNIQTPEAREKLEYRLGEQTFIMVPGARQLFIGTPHTHDSLYDKMEALGADCLTIPLFDREHRIDEAKGKTYDIGFSPEYVFQGIGKGSRLLREGVEYQVTAGRITFTNPPGGLVDCYAGCAWPERFTRDDLETRRRKTKTANYWDSQYQLHSRPIHDIRLDPSKMPEYTCEPVMRRQNGVATMWLGSVQIMSLSLRWDPSSGKLKSDTSAVALILQDGSGRRYWHRAVALKGEIAEFDPLDNKTIIGGQVHQLADLVREFNVPRVAIETNGIGAFSSAIVLACFQQQGLRCGVEEIKATASKNPRILEAFEGPLSSSMLWAHSSVLDGPAWDEMKDWNPSIREQPDDFLDAAAGAITDAPERVRSIARDQGDKFKTLNGHGNEDWRPSAGVFEVEVTH